MSHYTEIKLALKTRDRECIVRALEFAGFHRNQIEVHQEAVPLFDYCGNRTNYRWTDRQDERFKDGDRAHVIVRRDHMGQSQNDFGIYVDGENSVVFLCDFALGCDPQYCANPLARDLGGYTQWFERFQDEYAAQETILHHTERGEFAERVEDEDGSVLVYANAS